MTDGQSLHCQPSERKEFLFYISDMRAIACFYIVFFHMIYLTFKSAPAVSLPLASITESGTMTFVFIAGFLFMNSFKKSLSYHRFITKKLADTLLPYVIASFIIILLKTLKNGIGNFDAMLFLREFIISIPTGNAATPLWFIPFIMMCYCLSPFIAKIPSKLLTAPALCSVIVPLAIGRGTEDEFWRNCIYFIPFYLCGMAYSVNRATVESFLKKNNLLIFCLLSALGIASVVLFPEFEILHTLNKMAMMTLLFALTLRFSSESSQTTFAGKIISMISGASFTIYLYHNSVIGSIVAPIWRKITERYIVSDAGVVVFLVIASLCVTIFIAVVAFGIQKISRKINFQFSRKITGT